MEAPSTARAAYDLLGPGMWGRKVERGPGLGDGLCMLSTGRRERSLLEAEATDY